MTDLSRDEATVATVRAALPSTDFDKIPIAELPVNLRACEQNIRLNGWMMGGMLKSAKERLGHGKFMPWLASETDISQTTANDLMALYEGVRETPFLADLKQSAAVALLALPAKDREAFAAEHDAENLSVRALKEEIKAAKERAEVAEREAAQRAAELESAKASGQRAQELYTALNEQFAEQEAEKSRLLDALATATKPEAIAVEVEVEKPVEVAPPDYQMIKEQAESMKLGLVEAQEQIDAAQEYAVEMERKAKEAQTELRRLREQAGQGGASGGYDPQSIQAAVSEFVGRVALLPKMGGQLAMDTQAVAAYEQCVDLVADWVTEAREMLDQLRVSGSAEIHVI